MTKFVGYSKPIKGISKKTNEPYDFVKLYFIANDDSDVNGWYSSDCSFDTERLRDCTGFDYPDLATMFNRPVRFDVSVANGRTRISGIEFLDPVDKDKK